MKNRFRFCTVMAICLSPGVVAAHDDVVCDVPPNALLPDLMTVVPKHLGLQNQQQQEILRFSNGLANLGEGLWWMEPSDLDADPDTNPTQEAFQVFGDSTILEVEGPPASADPSFVHSCEVGSFEFHPTHNHWHIAEVAEFKVCDAASFDAAHAAGDPSSCTAFSTASLKVTFCLIDWYKMGENTSTSDPTRNFFACETGFQGVTPGWVDQYHQSTDGQQLNITGAPEGTYYLVSEINFEGTFVETDYTNNTSWVQFELTRHSQGNPKISVTGDACDDAGFDAQLDDAIAVYTQDPELAAGVKDDMCGGHSANR